MHASTARMRLCVRVSPPDSDSCQMVLALIRSCRVPNHLPQGLLMGRDSLLEFHAQPLGCVHAWGVACVRHSRVSLRNGPFRTIPDSLHSPQGFEVRVARPHHRFSTVEIGSHPPRAHICRCDRKPKVSIQPAPSHNRSPTRSQRWSKIGLVPLSGARAAAGPEKGTTK
jgi:hypothetical protein